MNYKKFALFKLLLLIVALGIAIFLAFGQGLQEITPDHKLVFVLDTHRTMNAQDVSFDGASISRLTAAKHIIQTTLLSEPEFSYGLIIFNADADYIIPPTFDTGSFLLYLSGITTNILPHGDKDFSVLTGVMKPDSYTSYFVISDFDTPVSETVHLPKSTSLLGIGSSVGDYVRYANGVRYYDSGTSVSTIRNDRFAQSLGLPYTTIATLDNFSPNHSVFNNFALPLGQRILFYVILGILVILVVML